MPQITAYALIKVVIDVVDETPKEEILEQVASEADYKIEYADQSCKVVSTEFQELTTDRPV